jgi:hypothetical protein
VKAIPTNTSLLADLRIVALAVIMFLCIVWWDKLHPVAALEVEEEGFGVAGLGDAVGLYLHVLGVQVRSAGGNVLAERHNIEKRFLSVQAVFVAGQEAVVVVQLDGAERFVL